MSDSTRIFINYYYRLQLYVLIRSDYKLVFSFYKPESIHEYKFVLYYLMIFSTNWGLQINSKKFVFNVIIQNFEYATIRCSNICFEIMVFEFYNVIWSFGRVFICAPLLKLLIYVSRFITSPQMFRLQMPRSFRVLMSLS